MFKIVTRESIRSDALAKKAEQKVKFSAPGASGEMGFTFDGSGEGKGKYFDQAALDRVKTALAAGEMMAPADLNSFINQVIVDVTEAKNQFPTVYGEIYQTKTDANYPKTLKVKDFIGLKAVFAKVFLGESISMAEFKSGVLEYAEFVTEACGYSVLRDWVLFNELWNITNANEAIGVAYNARMDNMHLAPICAATYSGGTATAKVTTGGTEFENVWLSLRQGIKDALKRKDPISGAILKPTLALCNTATAMDVEAAIKGGLQDGSTLGELGMIQKVVAYDGWSGTVNGVATTYAGPADGVVYLIRPKSKFISFVKEGRTKLSQKGNVLTLSEMDVAETFTMTLISDTENSVQEVTVL